MSLKNDTKIMEMMKELSIQQKELTKIVKANAADMSYLKENINLLREKFCDLSYKVDYGICSIDLASTTGSSSKSMPKVATTKTLTTEVKKKSTNIMSYFKEEYKLSIQTASNEFPQAEINRAKKNMAKILSDDEIEDLFKEHAADIKTKSKKKETLENFKAKILYSELIKPNEDKKKILRSLKEIDESANTVIEPEISEIVMDAEDAYEAAEETEEVIYDDAGDDEVDNSDED